MPKFSEDTLAKLTGRDDISKLWRKLIDEAAQHYLKYDIGHGEQYKEIGYAMLKKYPKIKCEGTEGYVSCFQSKITITYLF